MRRVLTLAFVALVAAATSAQWTSQASNIPAYHAQPPAKSANLPPILPAAERVGDNFRYPFQARSYELAEKHSSVLYQEPCYCFCDRSVGHGSLRSCFESAHGAHCATCMKEVFYIDQMVRQKKTAAQIRQGIIRGDWQQIDLQKAGSAQ
ncbi:MAG TPA: PCYCGC motif-containing (lipo)protein [Terriglobales bacterium]|nr:PCYCGC motif-containing (lipo)protein [Terriglobales bacterium]